MEVRDSFSSYEVEDLQVISDFYITHVKFTDTILAEGEIVVIHSISQSSLDSTTNLLSGILAV